MVTAHSEMERAAAQYSSNSPRAELALHDSFGATVIQRPVVDDGIHIAVCGNVRCIKDWDSEAVITGTEPSNHK